MTLVKVNPRTNRNSFPNNPFFSMVNDIMNHSFSDFSDKDFLNNSLVKSRPSINVIESKDDFRLEIAAPGLEKTDFNIGVEKDQLTISSKKESNEEKTEGKYTRREFNFSSFSRTFHLSEKVDSSNISATYENGILNVVIPKKEEAKEKAPFNISVN